MIPSERIVYLERLDKTARDLVSSVVPKGLAVQFLREGTHEEAMQLLGGVRVAIAATFSIYDGFLRQAPSLRFIQAQGVGLDNFDLKALRKRGVKLALNPIGSDSVGEHTILLMLAVSRRLPFADRTLRMGDWARWSLRSVSHSLSKKTVGIVGFGRNGREVAKRLRYWDCHVIFCDPVSPRPPLYGAEMVSERELLHASELLTLHLPSTPQTRNWLNKTRISQMKRGAIVINTSRGDLIDEDALVLALHSGRLGGAGLDVFALEPPPSNSPLWTLDCVVVTPHIAAGTTEVFRDKLEFAFGNIIRFLQGRQPNHLVKGFPG